MRLVDTVSRYRSQVTVHVDDRSADARSPMELLMLVATVGTKLRVVADGQDAQEALDALCGLIESGFSES